MTQAAQTNGTQESRLQEAVGGESEFERLLQRDFKPVTPAERFIACKQSFWSIANAMHKSGLVPNLRTPEAVFCILMFGFRYGWDAWTSIQNCHIINGRVSMSAASMLGLAINAGAKIEIKFAGRDGEPGAVGEWVSVTMIRPDFKPMTKTWTQADAKRAGLIKQDGNHQKYPETMLQWRCVADLCRALFADKVAGAVASEEMYEQIVAVEGSDPTWTEKEKKRSLKNIKVTEPTTGDTTAGNVLQSATAKNDAPPSPDNLPPAGAETGSAPAVPAKSEPMPDEPTDDELAASNFAGTATESELDKYLGTLLGQKIIDAKKAAGCSGKLITELTLDGKRAVTMRGKMAEIKR